MSRTHEHIREFRRYCTEKLAAKNTFPLGGKKSAIKSHTPQAWRSVAQEERESAAPWPALRQQGGKTPKTLSSALSDCSMIRIFRDRSFLA